MNIKQRERIIKKNAVDGSLTFSNYKKNMINNKILEKLFRKMVQLPQVQKEDTRRHLLFFFSSEKKSMNFFMNE